MVLFETLRSRIFFKKICDPGAYEALQDWASMWVSQRWTNFYQWSEKVLALYLVYWQSQDTQLAGSLKTIRARNLICCVRIILVWKKLPNFVFSCLSGFGFINLDPQRNEFPMVFWRTEGFGCMWVPFQFGSFNRLCLVFSLE